MSYQDSVAAEVKIYQNCVDVHELPPIFHYWSQRHLLPKLEGFGLSSPSDLFARSLDEACRASVRPSRFLSIGAGNCDLEVELARGLHAKGFEFIIDCLDLNAAMLERGRLAAEAADISSHLNFIDCDINTWQSAHIYDAAIANQFLHHVVNLEGLFAQIKQSLVPGGKFLISDMIGRNGHQRWPEALAIVQEFWRKLPPSYRFNRLVGYYEELYESWDCSVQGFEGVRSQDILPLLIEQFHFHLFLPYGNAIDPFIDRAFGPHFDASSKWDRDFIDAVHHRDDEEIASGRLKPTHMIAVVSNEPCPAPRLTGHLSPEFCVRDPEKMVPSAPPISSPYDSAAWPHDPQAELETACKILAETGREIKGRTHWALGLDQSLEERTAWALRLEKDVKSLTALAARLENEVQDRTAWAQSLDTQIEQLTLLAEDLQQKVDTLDQQVDERTLWAQDLDRQVHHQTSRADALDAELYKLIHNPFHLAARLLRGIRNRLFS